MELDPKDLKVDTFRTNRGSGSWAYKPDHAVRITHEPSGVYIEESGNRSQHMNKIEAMRKLLRASVLRPEMFEPQPQPMQQEDLRKAWDAYRGDAELSLDDAFIFAAGYIAGSSKK